MSPFKKYFVACRVCIIPIETRKMRALLLALVMCGRKISNFSCVKLLFENRPIWAILRSLPKSTEIIPGAFLLFALRKIVLYMLPRVLEQTHVRKTEIYSSLSAHFR
jgi:hypothetical protein